MFNFFKRRNLDTRLNSTEKTDAKNIAEMTVKWKEELGDESQAGA